MPIVYVPPRISACVGFCYLVLCLLLIHPIVF